MKAIFLDRYTGEALLVISSKGGDVFCEGDNVWVAREMHEDGNFYFLVDMSVQSTREDLNRLADRYPGG